MKGVFGGIMGVKSQGKLVSLPNGGSYCLLCTFYKICVFVHFYSFLGGKAR